MTSKRPLGLLPPRRGRRRTKTRRCPARKRDKYPRPAKEKLLCPLGKLRQPSCKTWWFVSVHTSIPTSSVADVPFWAWHRAMRSGRGRPIAFLRTSVRKAVRAREMASERIVRWVFCGEGREGEQARTARMAPSGRAMDRIRRE